MTIKQRLASVPIWGWIACLAALLRFVGLGHEALWYDEAYTATLARLPLPQLFDAIRGDVHPPLWYLIEWGMVHTFGSSEIVLRIIPAALGVALVLLIYRLTLHLGLNQSIATGAAFLVAILPGPIYYSQDARMYGLLSFFLLWALISMIKGKWLYFRVAAIGAMYTQNLAAFYILALLVGGLYLYHQDGRAVRSILWSGPIIGLALTPWIPSLLQQMNQVHDRYWIPGVTLPKLLIPVAEMTVGWRIPDLLIAQVYAVVFGLTLLAPYVLRVSRFKQDKGRLIPIFMIGGPGLIAIASLIWRPVYLSRAILPAMLCLPIVWAYMFYRLKRANQWAVLIVAAPALAISLLSYYLPDPNVARYDPRPALAAIDSQMSRQDVVYYVEAESAVVFQYYNDRLPYRLMPEQGDLAQSLSDASKAAMGLQSAPFETLKGMGFKRAWLIASRNPLSSSTEIEEIARIKATHNYSVVRVDTRPDASIYIYLVDL